MINKKLKKIIKKIIGVVLSLELFQIAYYFIIGFSEIIKNQTPGIITFYTLVAIIILWKLGGFMEFSLNMVFKD